MVKLRIVVRGRGRADLLRLRQTLRSTGSRHSSLRILDASLKVVYKLLQRYYTTIILQFDPGDDRVTQVCLIYFCEVALRNIVTSFRPFKYRENIPSHFELFSSSLNYDLPHSPPARAMLSELLPLTECQPNAASRESFHCNEMTEYCGVTSPPMISNSYSWKPYSYVRSQTHRAY